MNGPEDNQEATEDHRERNEAYKRQLKEDLRRLREFIQIHGRRPRPGELDATFGRGSARGPGDFRDPDPGDPDLEDESECEVGNGTSQVHVEDAERAL